MSVLKQLARGPPHGGHMLGLRYIFRDRRDEDLNSTVYPEVGGPAPHRDHEAQSPIEQLAQ